VDFLAVQVLHLVAVRSAQGHRRRGQGNVCLEPVGKDTLMLIVGESEMQTSST
jgi:hypothetical protein